MFLMIFAGITSKLENVGSIFSRFNPCSSLPSVATVACVQTSPPLSKNRRRALLRFLLRGGGFCTQAIATVSNLNIVLDNKTGLLFYWIQLMLKTRFRFLKRQEIAWHTPLGKKMFDLPELGHFPTHVCICEFPKKTANFRYQANISITVSHQKVCWFWDEIPPNVSNLKDCPFHYCCSLILVFFFRSFF